MADPVPKHSAARTRRNPIVGRRTLAPKPKVKAPPLRGTHHPRTRDWWKRIWKSPMAPVWIDTDIPVLERLADLLDEVYDGRLGTEFLSEIRHIEDRMGLTPLSRRRLNWEIAQSAADEIASPSKAEQKAQDDRWLRAVSD